MPNRVIKESICDSERINQLSPLEEVTFYRLLVNADDYGCFDAREMVVKSRLFPLKEIKPAEVKKLLARLAEVGLIRLYTVTGKAYLQVNKWSEHQRLRVSRHKYPTPDDADECGSLPQVAASCGKKSPESESESEIESESESEIEMRKAHERRFNEFWTAYPRKVSKPAARKAFDKVKPDDELLKTMLTAIAKQKLSDQWTKDNGQYIPHPATWLNNQRWLDELPVAKQKVLPAQDFRQRDYSKVEEQQMAQLAKEMEEFMQRGGQ